ncbi:FAD:protein FMN transferase [Gorillibacterium massiliense]|uniref:FAD:protein FMN transferase n=1 Tax=Gorillibacterium massiliense TaxID=1280390 RepID=UPI0004B1D7B8|nr:FAD:protein FMN transferase [Gorillibacterium massiliense]
MAAMRMITHSFIAMDTVVNLKVVSNDSAEAVNESIERAIAAFRLVEETCSRFDGNSELRKLSLTISSPQRVSPLLFESLRFARQLAETTGGIFDPTIGQLLERKGFARHYLTGSSPAPLPDSPVSVSFRDFELDEHKRTITLFKPMLLDLGAVAKGVAVDLAKRELEEHCGYLIEAGGDLFAGGLNGHGEPWHVGIRHPLETDRTIRVLRISDMAVCTSGSYERRSPLDGTTHHLLDPHTKSSSDELLSCTVIAPYAMLADGFSTAVFLLGRSRGLEMLNSMGFEGLLISSSCDLSTTAKMKRYVYE